MTTFDAREAGFEAKFAHDAEMQFRLHARRDKLLGLWAAGKLGLRGQGAEDYAAALVRSDIATTQDAPVLQQLILELAPHGVAAEEVQAALALCTAEAARQMETAA